MINVYNHSLFKSAIETVALDKFDNREVVK
jgi:hypothetical protein